MAATASALFPLLLDLDSSLVEAHLSALSPRYLERFSLPEIAVHIRSLVRLSPQEPVRAIMDGDPRSELRCTVVAFDYPSEFCFIAGVLSSLGFDILEGEVFTLGLPGRRKIIDSFSGRVRPESWSENWEELLAERLGKVVSILERGGKDSLRNTKREVAELAASALGEIGAPDRAVLYPVDLELDDSKEMFTRLRVVSRDTPFFLFAFSASLSLQGVSIEHVAIRTRGSRIEDEFDFTDASGVKIVDPARLDRIKLSVLLAKQFTSFLGGASDPRAAILRFEDLAADALALPDRKRWFELLSSRSVMGDLARLLGASDFLWEDFIRLQYESLIPMLRPRAGGAGICEPLDRLPLRLAAALEGADSEEAFSRALNAFKDREIFLFDLDHILSPGYDFLALSERLTALAELVVNAAASRAYEGLVGKYGEPRTAAGFPVPFAVMGLGKLGGADLGYASDIELLFVYGDSGTTAGPRVVENGEFFDSLVGATRSCIRAKREGIFQLDLRLRPYGESGPLACSLESFCTYYAPEGPAHSYERLALVRLRRLGGDATFGGRVERLRDEMVYSTRGFDVAEFRALRDRQLRYKSDPARPNAKFSPGALVDLEYAVQILQMARGAEKPALRSPRIHEALEALASIGSLEAGEAAELISAYHFFRRLINGLRMLRGSALDLSLPSEDSEEYLHLARRVGYLGGGELEPARSLRLDFEARTAEVRAFAERRFGETGFLKTTARNAADLVLSASVGDEERDSILKAKGFKDPARALVNLRRLSGVEETGPGVDAPRRSRFARLVLLACDILSQRPDPDMALNNWERFADAHPDPGSHLAEMLSQPKRLEILLDILSTSQFLADALVRRPALLEYVSDPRNLRARREESEMAEELDARSRGSPGEEQWRDELRMFRRKEILRIGARDICLGIRVRSVTEELSSLAECMIGAALRRIRGGSSEGFPRFCVVAFGKLGGRELNYSSDIDLLGLWDAAGPQAAEAEASATACMERLRAELSDHGSEGYAYRVDLRLRPYGSSGQLVSQEAALIDYYARSASLWEIQALLKARPVAGDLGLGRHFLDAARAPILAGYEPEAVVASIDSLRREALKKIPRESGGAMDVKSGLGGIRELEFLVQGLQLIHARSDPGLLQGNTLAGLEALRAARILPVDVAEGLAEDYIFLRKVEHFLQIYEDRQTHRLPTEPEQILALSRKMLGAKATVEQFRSKLDRSLDGIHREYLRFLAGAYWLAD
jgi:glutamate-ammonia-ligase adenylyltransferase